MRYFKTHAGKGVVGVAGATLLLAVPVSLPWLCAALLLAWGIDHLARAFRELEREEAAPPPAPSVPAIRDGQTLEVGGVVIRV